MKKILLCICFFVFTTTNISYAKEIENVPELYDINVNNVDMVMSTAAVGVYSTDDYRTGLFDRYTSIIESSTIPKELIDNSLKSEYTFWNKNPFSIVFKKNVDVTGLYMKLANGNTSISVSFKFYDEQNNLIDTITRNGYTESYIPSTLTNVKTITINTTDYPRGVIEFEIFIDPAALYSSVIDLKASNIKSDSATLKWTNAEGVTSNKVYLNGEVVTSDLTETFTFNDLESETEYTAIVSAIYEDIEVKKEIKFKTLKDTTPPGNVTNLTAEQSGETVILKWNNPKDKDFSHVGIYRNNQLIAKEIKGVEYTDNKPLLNQSATYRVVSYDTDDYRSTGTTVDIATVGTGVYNLKASAKDFTAVELSWENPKRNDLDKVTIYRKEPDKGVVASVMSFFGLTEEYTPLFETNGTNFKDLTVEADTNYMYKITTTINNVMQPTSATIEIKTPKMAVVGGEGTKTPEGDYVFTWQAPTTGKVRVDVAGKTFKTVEAADQKITIPKSIIQYDAFGNPLIKLTPVDDDGNPTGTTTTGTGSIGSTGNTNVELPDELTAKNLILMGVALLGAVGSFVLLALAFTFAPKLINMIRQAFEKRKGVANGK